MRDRINSSIALKLEVIYFQSNGAIAIVVHRDLDLDLQGYTFETFIYGKGRKLTWKCYVGRSQMLKGIIAICLFVMHDHDLHSQGQTLKMVVSQKWWKLAQIYLILCFLIIIFAMKWYQAYCECYPESLWPSFSMSNIFLFCICNKNFAMIVDVPRQICLHSHGSRRGATLVLKAADGIKLCISMCKVYLCKKEKSHAGQSEETIW